MLKNFSMNFLNMEIIKNDLIVHVLTIIVSPVLWDFYKEREKEYEEENTQNIESDAFNKI